MFSLLLGLGSNNIVHLFTVEYVESKGIVRKLYYISSS